MNNVIWMILNRCLKLNKKGTTMSESTPSAPVMPASEAEGTRIIATSVALSEPDAAGSDNDAHEVQVLPPDTGSSESAVKIEALDKEKLLLNKVKELLIAVGHDVEGEFDEIVALAKKTTGKH